MKDEQSDQDILYLKASLLHAQSRLDVLEGFFLAVHRNDKLEGIEGATVSQYFRDSIQARLKHNLAHVSDNNPELATKLSKILSDFPPKT